MANNKRVFITYKDVKILHELNSNSSVFYRVNKAKIALKKTEKQKITVTEYCKFVGISETEFYEKVEPSIK